ncbi:alpha/beta hydrolase [Dysgonomonas sp. OttesenSCG-928-M03]|nr:alpha/beta hydrolase [Dysgonomonas sp. OttesenSCG-928-M03]
MARKKWYKKPLRWILGTFLILLILMNAFSAIQAYSCTHFKENNEALTPNSTLSYNQIAKMLILGIEIPKPITQKFPDRPYKTIAIETSEGKRLSAWTMQTDSISKGLFIFFHGYRDEKSMLLDYSYQLLDMGYNVMLIDFMGSDHSYGLQTTIGYKEADNVKSAFDYASLVLKEENIYLLGFSMGAAAILKAQHDYNIPAKGLIAEASYGTMFDTVKVRLGGQSFMSHLLAYMFTFWGGITNDINAFEMNPEEFAKNISVPVLISCGGKDQYIPQSETQRIYDNIPVKKKMLKFYPECIHEPYLKKYPEDWKENIKDFLNLTEQY